MNALVRLFAGIVGFLAGLAGSLILLVAALLLVLPGLCRIEPGSGLRTPLETGGMAALLIGGILLGLAWLLIKWGSRTSTNRL